MKVISIVRETQQETLKGREMTMRQKAMDECRRGNKLNARRNDLYTTNYTFKIQTKCWGETADSL